MEVTIQIPKAIIDICLKNKIKESKIPFVYKHYIDFATNRNGHDSEDGFMAWLDGEGEEEIESFISEE